MLVCPSSCRQPADAVLHPDIQPAFCGSAPPGPLGCHAVKPIWLALLGVLLAHPAQADPPPPLLLQAEGQTLNPVCTGQDVQLEGNHNVVKPFGLCHSLLIKGIGNQITLDFTANPALRIEGSGNRVTYRAPTAATTDMLGTDNAVVAQPAPVLVNDVGPVLNLSGDDHALAMDCAGRSVSVDGSRALYLLRGGCKELTVHGDLVVVQAELQPGAPVAIIGHGSRVGWVLNGPGKPPVLSLHGEANRVEHLSELGGIPTR
jgi:hypothetical protein